MDNLLSTSSSTAFSVNSPNNDGRKTGASSRKTGKLGRWKVGSTAPNQQQ